MSKVALLREISFKTIVWIVCVLIAAITFSWVNKGKVTSFKIWRIRKFTRLKIWLVRKHPKICSYFGSYQYLKYIEEKFG